MISCGGSSPKLFYNENYTYMNKNEPILAIAPSAHEQYGRIIDRAFHNVFKSRLTSMSVLSGSELRKTLDANEDFAILLSKAADLTYADTTTSNVPSLLSVLSNNEMVRLRRFLRNADFVLLPVNYIDHENERPVLSSIMCRLFDLDTGELIYDKPSTGLLPAESITNYDDNFLVISYSAYKEFQNLFLEPFILRD
jgi:hypothetical protein